MSSALLPIMISTITSLVYLLLSSISDNSMEPWLGSIVVTVALLSTAGSILFQIIQLNKETKQIDDLRSNMSDTKNFKHSQNDE